MKKVRFDAWKGPERKGEGKQNGEVAASGLVRSCGPKRVAASSASAVADQKGLHHLWSRSARVDQLIYNANVLMGDFNMSAVAEGEAKRSGAPTERNFGRARTNVMETLPARTSS